MSYQNTSIKQIVTDIEHSKAYLPAIQRRFVWPRWKIEKLFDSIMRNYPIGSFLFWTLKKDKANEYVFYEFLKAYDERNPYNKRKTGSFLYEEIVGVLDGQQRLSSIYLGLQGTHAVKLKNFKRKSDHAYPETKLYLNLLNLPYIENDNGELDFDRAFNFEFKFLTESESKLNTGAEGESIYWFLVGDILKWNDDPDIDDIFDNLTEGKISDVQKAKFKEQKRFVKKGLRDLHKRLNEPLVNYFNIKNDDLEDILEIFIRVNSGGTILSKTDLLFSTIVATWEDGRDVIENFLKHINQKGEGFSFNNDFLMRTCLVLCDLPVLFKVNSFKSENVQLIKNKWSEIEKAVNRTLDLLIDFGFSRENLASQNSIIIIAYFIFKGGNYSNATSVDNIHKYLLYSHLKNIYGGQGDQIIGALRNVLRGKSNEANIYNLESTIFPLEKMLEAKLAANKSLKINKDDIADFMNTKLSASSFYILSLLYPSNKFSEVYYHQDHLHPNSGFRDKAFDSINLTEEDRKLWLELKDTLPNLQLLEGRKNESKNNSALKDWVNGENKHGLKNVPDLSKFFTENYLDNNISLDFSDFLKFYEMRKGKMISALEKMLI